MSNWEFIEIMLFHTFDLSLVSFMALFIKLVHFSWFGLFSCGFSTISFHSFTNSECLEYISNTINSVLVVFDRKHEIYVTILKCHSTVSILFKWYAVLYTVSIDAQFCLHNYLHAATVTCSIHWAMFRDF